jgi:hypothetical protein
MKLVALKPEPGDLVGVVTDRDDTASDASLFEMFGPGALYLIEGARRLGDEHDILVMIGRVHDVPIGVFFTEAACIDEALGFAFEMVRALGESSNWGLRLADDALQAKAVWILKTLGDGGAGASERRH